MCIIVYRTHGMKRTRDVYKRQVLLIMFYRFSVSTCLTLGQLFLFPHTNIKFCSFSYSCQAVFLLGSSTWPPANCNEGIRVVNLQFYSNSTIQFTFTSFKISVIIHDFHAVSYTHLDVYKRQLIIRINYYINRNN